MIRRRSFRMCLALIGLSGLYGTAGAATNPTPHLALPLIPAAAAPGDEAFTLTVDGTGFVLGAVVNWNGSARTTTFLSNSQLKAAITPDDVAIAGTATITVTNPAPGGGTSNAEYFAVTNSTTTLAFQDSLLPKLANATEVVVGDFNGDGKPDLAVLEYVYDVQFNIHWVLNILVGNGDGTFQPPIEASSAPSGVFVHGLAVGDFNADGKLDLVVSFQGFDVTDSGISVFLGNGDGTFRGPLSSDFERPSNSFDGSATMQVADVNGDGILDLVRACQAGVCVELGGGDGTFRQGFTYPPNSPLGSGVNRAQAIALGDFHKNGKLDIVAGQNIGNSGYVLQILPGNGDGTFGPPSLFYGSSGPIFQLLDGLATADFDGDGNLDLAFFATDSNPSPNGPPQPKTLNIMKGNGDGAFQAPLTIGGLPGLPDLTGQSVVIPADFNGDGHIDVAVKGDVVLIKRLSAEDLDYTIVPLAVSHTAMAAADFNGDGRLDLVDIDFNAQQHLVLQVDPGDFRAGADPATQRIGRGGKTTFNISISPINEFKGTVSFNVSGLPVGATAVFSPSTVSISGTTQLMISATGETPMGSYPLVWTATSGNLSHSGTITLNVGPKKDFTDFTVSVQESFQTITPGVGASFHISTAPLNGFIADVALSVSGLPAGAASSFSPSEIDDGSGASVLTVTTLSGTPTGTYPLTITGISEEGNQARTHSVVANLNVGPAGTDFRDFTLTVTPVAQTVAAGSGAIFTITTTAINGPLDVFFISDSDAPVTVERTYPFNVIFGGSGSVLLGVLTSPLTPPGTYTIRVGAFTGGRVEHGAQATITVTP